MGLSTFVFERGGLQSNFVLGGHGHLLIFVCIWEVMSFLEGMATHLPFCLGEDGHKCTFLFGRGWLLI